MMKFKLTWYGEWWLWWVLLLSLLGNFLQYEFFKGYDKNVLIISESFEREQLENFDLNRALHEKNLMILDLQRKLKECMEVLKIVEEESDGSIAVQHILEDD
jgi:hypothetical protein